MPLDPKVVHVVDQFQAEALELAQKEFEDGLHANGACSNEFDRGSFLLLQSAMMAGANGAMVALFNAGRMRDATDIETCLFTVMRKILTADWGHRTVTDNFVTINIEMIPLTPREAEVIRELSS